MSYTTFRLDGVEAEAGGGGIRVRASVANTGRRRGTEVVQVYAERDGSARPARLVSFRTVELEAGQTTAVELDVTRDALAERDTGSHAMVTPAGTYRVRVARHACDPGTTVPVAMT